MAVTDVTMDKIVSLCRRRGFVFPSSEIYGGLGSTYDYGHYGVLMKNHIRSQWLRAMVQERDDMVAIDSAVILTPAVWEASGHVGGFSDPLIDCRTCKLRFRADRLEDAQCGRKPSKRPGEFSECDLTEPRQFNLMFQTQVGAMQDASSTAYLRPETAQGIFINFKNVSQLARRKPPFGIAQDGERYTPHVVEPAVSIERIFVAMLCDAYDEEVVGERERTVLRLHPLVAPVKAAVLPLIPRDEGISSRARELFEQLRKRHWVEYDDSGQIGRRYRRQDEIGTPWAFTADEQTLEDETVTVRDRDSLAQERLPIAEVEEWLDAALERPWSSPKA